MSSDTGALEAFQLAIERKYADFVIHTEVSNHAEYAELKIIVEAEDEREASDVAVNMIPSLVRLHSLFDDEKHKETVMPAGGPDENRYEVYVRQRT